MINKYFWLAWEYVTKNESAIDALVAGCGLCEETQCHFTVGFGGNPDENGETRLDAMVFDGYFRKKSAKKRF